MGENLRSNYSTPEFPLSGQAMAPAWLGRITHRSEICPTLVSNHSAFSQLLEPRFRGPIAWNTAGRKQLIRSYSTRDFIPGAHRGFYKAIEPPFPR